MVNQLKKDLPESQKSPFPLQTDVIPHHSRQRLPHPAISERAWFHPSSSKLLFYDKINIKTRMAV